MIRQLLVVLVLGVAMALGTWWVGWWVVPVLGAAWGVARYGAYPSVTSGVAAALGWMLLVGAAALRGPMGDVSRLLGASLSLPGWVPLLLTLVFPGALAAAAAKTAGGVLPLLEGVERGGGRRVAGEAERAEAPGRAGDA